LIVRGTQRVKTRATLPGIAKVKNMRFLVVQGQVSRNSVKFSALAKGIFPSHSLSMRLLLPPIPLSILLMRGEYSGGQDPGVLGTAPVPERSFDSLRSLKTPILTGSSVSDGDEGGRRECRD
jgi:hypothetical protein